MILHMTNTTNRQAIAKGEKHNSMFEPNTVQCRATKQELQAFYKDSEGLSPPVNTRMSAISFYDVDNVDCLPGNSLIIKVMS